MTSMVNVLQVAPGHSEIYRQLLLDRLEAEPVLLSDPITHSWFLRGRAIYAYHREDYETARFQAVEAYRLARMIGYPPNRAYSCQMVGIVHTKRKRWELARRYLRSALAQMEKLDAAESMVFVKRSLANVTFEQQDYSAAIEQLDAVLEEARTVLNDAAYQRLKKSVETDIAYAREQLASAPIN